MPQRTITDPGWSAAPPRDVRGFVLPLLAAAVLGLATGVAPLWTGLAVIGGGVLAVLLWRVELAALTVIIGSVFEDDFNDRAPWAAGVLVAVLVASWAVRRIRRPLHGGAHSRVTDAVAAFLVVLLVATLAHPNQGAGVDVLLRYVGFVAVTLVLIEVLRGPLQPQVAALAYVAVATLASAYGLVTSLLAGDGRVVGPIEDPNILAFALLAAMPLALGLRRGTQFDESGWPIDRLLEVALVVLLLGLVGTFSRGALVGLAVMVVVAVATRLLSVTAVMAVVAVLLIGSSVAAMTAPDLVRSSVEQKELVAHDDLVERLDLWRTATTMTLENPVLGLGPGSLARSYVDDRSVAAGDSVVSRDVVHNTWLEVSAELGLLGLLALLGVVVSGVSAAWRRWRRVGDPLSAGVCTALAGTGVTATFVTVQYYLPLWLLIALGAALNTRALSLTASGPTRQRGA